MGLQAIFRQSPEQRKERARALDERLDPYMTALGALFLLLVLSERGVPEGSALATVFEIVAYVIWGAFVAEFILRLVIEPDTKRFLRRNWWQIPILVLPILRFLRLFRLLRIGRAGRLVTSAMRASRSASSKLRGRLTWIATIHVIIVLTATNVLSDLAATPFGHALHDASLAATTGEPIPGSSGLVDVLEVGLAIYSVVFFAAITGSLGTWYIERRQEAQRLHNELINHAA